MKLIIALLALMACRRPTNAQSRLNLTAEQKFLAFQHTLVCMEQEKTTLDAGVALMRGQFAGLNRNAKCFANCFLERAGFLIDGAVQSAVILDKLGPNLGHDKVNAIMTQCNGLKGSDNCETAFVLYECYYKQNSDSI